MRFRSFAPQLGAAAAIFAVSAAMPMHAQPAPDATLDIRFIGLDNIEPHEKDRAAYDAFRHLGSRIAELPSELEGEEQAEVPIRLGWHALMGKWGFRIAPGMGPMGLGGAFWTDPMAPAQAQDWLNGLIELLQNEGAPIEQNEAGWMLMTPGGPITLDKVNDSAAISMGMPDIETPDVQGFDLPDGSTPILSASFDLRTISGMVSAMTMQQGPELAELLGRVGITGPNAWKVDFATGVSGDEMVFSARMHDVKGLYENMGMEPGVSFSPSMLRAVPRDATIVSASPIHLESMLWSIDMQAEETGQDIWGELEEMTGVDVRNDVFAAIGSRALFYQSDTTGGGGLLSAVLSIELDDAEAFAGAHESLKALLKGLLDENVNGYIRFAERDIAGRTVHSVITPSLPVPVEVCWTVTDGLLFVAASPTTMRAALGQLDDPRTSILDNEAFSRWVAPRMGDAPASLTFMDSTRLAGDGYGVVAMGLRGLVNGVMSRDDDSRTVTGLMPGYHDFVSDVRPMSSVMNWDGDDLVMMGWADRSFLVNAAATASQVDGLYGIGVAGVMAGTLLPALSKARESAMQLKSATQCRGIGQAMILYAQNNGDRYPTDIQQLIDEGLIPAEMTVSPFGEPWEGGPGLVMRTQFPEGGGSMTFDSEEILVVDRVMYQQGSDGVNVCFGDNHVELLDWWELDEMLELPINEGARESMGLE